MKMQSYVKQQKPQRKEWFKVISWKRIALWYVCEGILSIDIKGAETGD